MSYGRSGSCPGQICPNDDRYAAFIYASTCITHHSDLAHMVEIIEIGYGTSWKSRRRCWMRRGEEVELYLLETGEMIYMPYIAGRKHRNVIGPYHFSPRNCG